MKGRVFLFLLLMLSAVPQGRAELRSVTIPGHGWQLSFDIPSGAEEQILPAGERFSYMAQDLESGIVFSFHVEPWDSGGNAECRSTYWEKAALNPFIDKTTIRISDTERLSQVLYVFDAEVQGLSLKSVNANFYFVYKGSCVDVHVSKHPYAEGDEQTLIQIGDSLNWGESE